MLLIITISLLTLKHAIFKIFLYIYYHISNIYIYILQENITYNKIIGIH